MLEERRFRCPATPDLVGPALAATFMTWVSYGSTQGSSPAFGVSKTGLQMDLGKIVAAIAVIVLLATWFTSRRVAGIVRYIGGGLIICAFFLELWWHGQIKQQVMEEASLAMPESEVATAVTVDNGMGLWLTLLAGIFIVGVERNRRKTK